MNEEDKKLFRETLRSNPKLSELFMRIGAKAMEKIDDEVCKNGSKDCCDSEYKHLCDDCQWDEVGKAMDIKESLK